MTTTTIAPVATTEKEYRVLRAILTNWFGNSDPTAEIWSAQIDDANEPSGLRGKTLSAVCSTLTQKGLVKSSGSGRDAVIWLTAAGIATAQAPRVE